MKIGDKILVEVRETRGSWTDTPRCKIKDIKNFRAVVGAGLKESKDAVEQLWESSDGVLRIIMSVEQWGTYDLRSNYHGFNDDYARSFGTLEFSPVESWTPPSVLDFSNVTPFWKGRA